MNLQHQSSSHPDHATTVAADLESCRQLAMELAQMGMERARLLHGQVMAQGQAQGQAQDKPRIGAANDAGPDKTAKLDQVERAVRQAIMLVRHLAEPLPEAKAVPKLGRFEARRRLIRAVEDRIARDSRVAPQAERLRAEFLDRLDRPEFDDELAGRPLDEIVADICHDLGVDVPDKMFRFKRRTRADLDELDTIAARPVGCTDPLPATTAPLPTSGNDLIASEEAEIAAILERASRLRLI